MRILPILLVLALAAALSGCAGAPIRGGHVVSPYFDLDTLEEGQIVHLPTGRTVSEDELVDLLADRRVVFVGESHDSVEDHGVQLEILKRLDERFPGRVALGLEMMRRPFQADADKWSAGEMEEKDFVRVWQKNWSNSFPYYADILRYVRDRRIPLLALNRQKSMPGAHEPLPEGMPPPPEPTPEPEVDENDPYYSAVIGAFFRGHGEGKPDIEKMFVRGQALWDETMAETSADYLARPENADKKLIVFAGGNHVRHGFGIPRRFFRRLPVSYAIVEPMVTEYPEEKRDKLMDVDLPELPLPLADFAWGVGYTDLESRRVLLGVRIEQADPEGAKVVGVNEGSSAEAAGIKEGDVIVAVDGVAVKELFDLTYEVSLKEIGKEGTVALLREGERLELPVTFRAAAPPKDSAPAEKR